MDSESLRTFLAIHRHGGVTRAAAALFRSQPAVSRRLALLERELGMPLFERVPGGVELSEAGRALLPYAERALAALSDAEAAVRAVRSPGAGSVAVALVGTLAGTGLTPVLRGFAARHPGVELTLRTATSHEVSELVRRAEVGLGLRYGSGEAPELCHEPLFSERLVLVAAPDHPLAALPAPTLADLAGMGGMGGMRWITFPELPGRGEASAAYVRRAMEEAGVPEDRVLRIDSLTAQKRLVEAGFGIAMLPESGVQEELAAGSLAAVEVAGLAVAVPVTVVTRRDGFLGAAARTLLAELRAAAGDVAVTPLPRPSTSSAAPGSP
ncbi:DNA-binding transcriptional LysR family regulator [Thermocatellispora tengchongensis]|uniref:DNA-binding transcriptional LysR family regulator n=1 Tax=Thermocatellispora tengchongensis TaxID=1073253 RepID=A0A840NRW9_9ACTN|nr:LysR family transcriptional regulator [Thermocatellispora tengchongensis]MBB5130328.1 DNA-binding transcriptional LysR family regulator [Thermocatellispora tengchongensis]